MLILNILEWILVVVSFITFVFLSFWVISNKTKKTRFTQIPNLIFEDIEKNLKIQKGSVIYGLGCGDGRILFFLKKRNPNIRFVFVEDNPFLLFLIHLHNWWDKLSGKNGIEVIGRNFFDCDLSEATHILTYLYPNIMDDLLPKFDKELRKGTRLISLNFHFTSKQPIAEIEFNKIKFQPDRKIYVYEF